MTKEEKYLSEMCDYDLLKLHKEMTSLPTIQDGEIARRAIIDLYGSLTIPALQIQNLIVPMLNTLVARFIASPAILDESQKQELVK